MPSSAHRIADLTAAADRAEAMIQGEDQRLVAWGAPGEPPLVAGRSQRTLGRAARPRRLSRLRHLAAGRIRPAGSTAPSRGCANAASPSP